MAARGPSTLVRWSLPHPECSPLSLHPALPPGAKAAGEACQASCQARSSWDAGDGCSGWDPVARPPGSASSHQDPEGEGSPIQDRGGCPGHCPSSVSGAQLLSGTQHGASLPTWWAGCSPGPPLTPDARGPLHRIRRLPHSRASDAPASSRPRAGQPCGGLPGGSAGAGEGRGRGQVPPMQPGFLPGGGGRHRWPPTWSLVARHPAGPGSLGR